MKKDWQYSEDRTAKNYGRKQPASGSKLDKLDIQGTGIYQGLFCENKYTKAKSRSIKLEELRKAEKQASNMGGTFFFLLDFMLRYRYVMCSENYWINIHEELEELRNEKRGESSSTI